MIKKLRKDNQLLCTSRDYREVVKLAKIRDVSLVFVGKHGGADKSDKLGASLKRMSLLFSLVKKFAPELAVSFCSPEAARISYGFGVKHIAFSDSPHAEAVMRLSIPLIQKLLTPWIIPKKEFLRYGISKNDIIHYKAIDAAVIVKGKSKSYSRQDFPARYKRTILIRTAESEAAYISDNKTKNVQIIRGIVREFSKYNIVILGRYSSQISQFKREFGNKVIVMNKVIDGKGILGITDIFIGSGGTMTAEAALMGIPTISYDAVPNYVEKYLVEKDLIKRERNPKKMIAFANQIQESDIIKTKKRAKKVLDSMEDPFFKLVPFIKTR